MSKVVCFVAVLLAMLATPAAAEGWYVIAGAGAPSVQNAPANMDFESGVAWHVGGGYQMTENLAAEVVYHDFGDLSETTPSAVLVGGVPVPTTRTASGDVKGFEISVVLSKRLHRLFEPFVKGGFFVAETDYRLSHVDGGGVTVLTAADDPASITGIGAVGVNVGPVVLQYAVIPDIDTWSDAVRIQHATLSYRVRF